MSELRKAAKAVLHQARLGKPSSLLVPLLDDLQDALAAQPAEGEGKARAALERIRLLVTNCGCAITPGHADRCRSAPGWREEVEEIERVACEGLAAPASPTEPSKCGTTHYAGCACHEARRDAELEELRGRVAEVLNYLHGDQYGRATLMLEAALHGEKGVDRG